MASLHSESASTTPPRAESSARPRRSPTGKGLWVSVLVAGLGLLVLCLNADGLWNGWCSRSWPTVPGTIALSAARRDDAQGTDPAARAQYSADIAYTYAVAGSAQKGTRVAYRGVVAGFLASALAPSANAAADRYSVGKEVRVACKPGQPGTSVLEPGLTTSLVVDAVLGSLLLLVGLAGAIIARNARLNAITADVPSLDAIRKWKGERGAPEAELQVLDLVRRYAESIEDEHVFFASDIPARKLRNARSRYASGMAADEFPLVLIDDTAFGSAKAGVLITDRALYAKSTFEAPVCVPLAELYDVAHQSSLVSHTIEHAGGRIADVSSPSEAVMEHIASMLRKIGRTLAAAELSQPPDAQPE